MCWDFNCSISFKGDYRQTHSKIMNLAQLNSKQAAAFYAAKTALPFSLSTAITYRTNFSNSLFI